jgi:hypothetical protein
MIIAEAPPPPLQMLAQPIDPDPLVSRSAIASVATIRAPEQPIGSAITSNLSKTRPQMTSKTVSHCLRVLTPYGDGTALDSQAICQNIPTYTKMADCLCTYAGVELLQRDVEELRVGEDDHSERLVDLL